MSNTAGTFVCNHVLYQLGYLADKYYPNLRFGFIFLSLLSLLLQEDLKSRLVRHLDEWQHQWVDFLYYPQYVTAGTFVCNHVLYQLGYLADNYYPNLRFGFIHVPFIPEQYITNYLIF
jgi:pyrrolidone-carboxylate peptidase